MKITRFVFVLTLFWSTAWADVFRVGTLNCFLLFSPAINHPGKVDEESAMTVDVYENKLENLARLSKADRFDVLSIQEVGGREEVSALAAKAGMEFCFAKGRDTYTGQNVALLYQAKAGYKITPIGRVGELDSALSKHVLLRYSPVSGKAGGNLYFLAIHLIRPIGSSAEKHDQQLASIARWAEGVLLREPDAVVLVAGDTNNPKNVKGGSCLGFGFEAGELIGYPATHLNGRTYDRLVVAGSGKWVNSSILRPSYGKKPNESLVRVNTDHFLLSGVFETPN